MRQQQIIRATALMIISFLLNTSLKAQWYSYDGFEKRTNNSGMSLNVTNQVINAAARTSSKRAFRDTMDARADSLSKLIKQVKKKKDTLILSIRDSIIRLLNQVIGEHNSARKDSLQKHRDSFNLVLQNIYADRSLEDMIILQREQFKYAKKRAPGLHFFPAGFKSAAFAYFDNSDTIITTKEDIFQFEHAYLNYLTGSKKIAAYTEPLFDYLGPVRVSLGLMALAPSTKDSAVTTKKSDSIWNKKVFTDKFRSGGGIAQVNFMYPLLFIHDNRYIDFKLYASPRFSIDAPQEDTSVQRFAHHTQLGVEAQLKITTFNENFKFLLCFRGMQAWGNKTFMDNMGFQGKDRKSFNFNTWTVGLIAKKHLAFYYTWYSGDTRAINQVSKPANNSLTANYQF
jgi:hypothetical protein